MDIKKFVRPNIRSLSAYKANEILCKVKLDANESPYGLIPALRKQFLHVFTRIEPNRYPDSEARELKAILAKLAGVSRGNILIGNGSDELLYYLIITFGGPILYPIPTFSMYSIIAQALGERKIEIPLCKDFDIDLEKTLSAIKAQRPKLVFLSSPNNPTGNCFSSEKILRIVRESPGLVVVDEAYLPFSSSAGFLPRLKKQGNLIVLKTISKIGFAGLRIGYLIANKEIISEVNKVRLPFNLNSLSQVAAIAALQHKDVIDRQIAMIKKQRGLLYNNLKTIIGIKPFPSEANFILFKVDNADRVYKELLYRGILIRNMNGALENYLRVTVGTPEENKLFLKAMKEVMNENSKG